MSLREELLLHRSGEKSIPVVPALCVLPLALLLLGLVLRAGIGPYFLGANQDPAYPYLLNSLNILSGRAPSHIDHPGTPLQVLGAVVLWVRWRLGGGGASEPLDHSVLGDPEGYLHAISTALMLFVCLAHFLAGAWVYRVSRRLAPALFLQLGVFCFPQLVFAMVNVSPEPLLLAAGLLLVPALVAGATGREEWRGCLVGAALGFGVASKVTFIPLVPLLFLFRSLKARAAALLSCLIAFLFCTIPIQGSYPRLYEWLKALLLHKGRYGEGEPGVADLPVLLHNLAELSAGEPFLSATLAGYLMLLLFLCLSRQRGEGSPFRLLLVVALVIAAQLVVTAKHPSAHYLLPSMALGVLGNAALFLWAQTTGRRRLCRGMALFLVLGLVLSLGPVRSRFQGAQSMAAAERELARYLTGNPGARVVPYYRSNSEQYALSFGNIFAGGFFAEELDRRFPEALFYDMWKARFYSFKGAVPDASVQQLVQSGAGVVLTGAPLPYTRPGAQLTLRPVSTGGGVALYRLGATE